MKTKNIVILILVIAALGYLLKMLFDKLKDAGQDLIHNATPAGWLGVVRSAEAQKAANSLLKLKWMTETFYRKAEPKYNTSRYTVDIIGTAKAQEIAKKIKNANSNVPFGFMDDSRDAVRAVMEGVNQAQIGEITHAYFGLTGKDLNKGINWLSDSAMIDIAEYLHQIPTGIYDKVLRKDLDTITI